MTKPLAQGPLSIWIVLPQGFAPGPGPRRLLSQLQGDGRFSLSAVVHAPLPRDTRSWAVRRLLQAESRLFPAPDAMPPGALPDPVLSPEQAAQQADAPDVILDFTLNPSLWPLAQTARFGLWWLDAYDRSAALPAAFAGQPTAAVQLCCTTGDQRLVLAQVVYDAKPLAAQTQAYLREKSVQLMVHHLARIAQGAALTGIPAAPPRPGSTWLVAYAGHVAHEAWSRASLKLRRRLGRTPRQFRLTLGHGTLRDFDPASARDIPPRPNTFWADPFLFDHDSTLWCFFEEYDYRTGLGQIAVGRVTDTGVNHVGTALAAPHHLSFPYVFRDGPDIFMIPETNATRRIEIWRATDFPTGWTLHATALAGQRAADTVLTQLDGTWWLFTNLCHDSFGDFCSDLSLFRTSGPDLAWIEPHALNPVITGSDRARNAGRVLARDGKLFRLAQDNSGGVYGYGFKVMEIEALSPDDYAERCVRHVTPDFRPGLIGTHHFDTAAGQFVIDVRRP